MITPQQCGFKGSMKLVSIGCRGLMTEFEEGDECVGGVVHLGRTGTDILKTREEATQRG